MFRDGFGLGIFVGVKLDSRCRVVIADGFVGQTLGEAPRVSPDMPYDSLLRGRGIMLIVRERGSVGVGVVPGSLSRSVSPTTFEIVCMNGSLSV